MGPHSLWASHETRSYQKLCCTHVWRDAESERRSGREAGLHVEPDPTEGMGDDVCAPWALRFLEPCTFVNAIVRGHVVRGVRLYVELEAGKEYFFCVSYRGVTTHHGIYYLEVS